MKDDRIDWIINFLNVKFLHHLISLGNKTACSLPLIEEQLTEVQEALSKLASQVQKIQESLQAVRKTKPETGSNQNNSSVSEMSIIEPETAT